MKEMVEFIIQVVIGEDEYVREGAHHNTQALVRNKLREQQREKLKEIIENDEKL